MNQSDKDPFRKEGNRDMLLAIPLLILLLVGVFFTWHRLVTVAHYRSAPKALAAEEAPLVTKAVCAVPDNPYVAATSEYGGWEWGENGNSCTDIPSRFVHGCQAFKQADAMFAECMNRTETGKWLTYYVGQPT